MEREERGHLSKGSEYRMILVDRNLCQRAAGRLNIPASELNCGLTFP